MTLYFEDESNHKLDLELEEIARTVIENAIDYVQCPYECEVNLMLTDNEAIRSMNQEFRQIDKATDVLSFPMVEYSAPGEFQCIEEQTDCFHPETGELLLGDIVISKDKVLEQSEEYGHSIKREYAFLIAHSMLHLFGYDHMAEDERQIMEAKQKEILNELGITR